MPRPKSVIPNRRFSTTIPEVLATRLDLHLYSDLTGQHTRGPRPGAALQKLIIDLLLRFFEEKELDLAPFCGTMPGEHIIRGTPAALRALSNRMEV